MAARRSTPTGTGSVKKKAAPSGSGRGSGKRASQAPPPPPSRPWGTIATITAVVVFCFGIIGVAYVKSHSHPTNKSQAAAKKLAKEIEAQATARPEPHIQGVVSKTFKAQVHQTGAIKYTESPPFGGPHSPVWADCMGTLYPIPIASENAVHSLEHGAVWITYKQDLPRSQIDTLSKLVGGVPYMFMSPYDGLDKPISLQAWGHQLKVDSASDPRVKEFILGYRQNPQYTPEKGGECSNPTFKSSPSSQGTPMDTTASPTA